MNVERIKKFKIMKTTLRYLLMVVAMVSVLGVYAQGLAQQPEVTMQSTSTMVGTGSSLPQAATTGVYVTGSTPASYSPAGRPGYIRKGASEEDKEDPDTPPEDPHGPMEDPIGDAALPLALLAGVYALMRVILIRKRAGERR